MSTTEVSWPDRALFFFNGCPFCKSDGFLEGPHGGLSINFQCSNCGARFNDMGPFGIQLLSASDTKRVLI